MPVRGTVTRYFAGATSARIGDEMSGPALLLVGLALTGSTSSASLLLSALTITAAVGGPILGAALDRTKYRSRLLAASLGVYATGLSATLLTLGHAPLVVCLLIAGAAGLFGPAVSGGWTAQLPSLTPESQHHRVNALDAATFNAAAVLGAPLAGIVATAAGPSAAALIAVVAVAIAAALAWTVPEPPRVSTRRDEGLGRLLRAGITVLGRNRRLRRATVLSVACIAGEAAVVVSMPLVGVRLFHSAGLGTVLLVVPAVTALATPLVFARYPTLMDTDRILPVSGIVQVLALGAIAAAPNLLVVLVPALGLLGISQGAQLTALFAVRHQEAPEGLRAQVFTTGASLKISGFALGAAFAGLLASKEIGWALLAAALISLAGILPYATRIRNRREPRPPPLGSRGGQATE